ncbi:hypothetical protein B0J12DRAFT_47244 [Macrophomina phaseolina]|uniref:DUF7918 domain-containing protein n=1 Tax=Macrophomina phaseolina TaxID=35725 RepID=A0ABQ8GEE8_9PEZI|nr:hypothetical protein B0J12DRAFT_47244 [Macrophomina phaseolina]
MALLFCISTQQPLSFAWFSGQTCTFLSHRNAQVRFQDIAYHGNHAFHTWPRGGAQSQWCASYGDGENETNITTLHIETVSGANFSIPCNRTHASKHSNKDILMQVFTEGQWINGRILIAIKRGSKKTQTISITWWRSVENGNSQEKPFIFSDINTGEDIDFSSQYILY